MKPLQILITGALSCSFSIGQTPAPPDSGYAVRSTMLMGMAAPGTETGRFEYIGTSVMNNNGDIAFGASISNSKFSSGLFLLTKGGVVKIALNGEAAAYLGGVPYSEDFAYAHISLNDLGQVAFGSQIGGWTNTNGPSCGVFYYRANDVVAIALFPPLARGVPDYITGVSLNNNWQIAFSKNSGVYVYSSSNNEIVPLVTSGQPYAGGGTFQEFSRASINNVGQIAFSATVAKGLTTLFLYTAASKAPSAAGGAGVAISSILPIVQIGQTVPGASGFRLDGFRFAGPDDSGQIVFSGEEEANINAMGITYRSFGIFIYLNGVVSPIAILGQKVANQPSESFSSISTFAQSSSGVVTISGGYGTEQATFRVSEGNFSRALFYLDGNPPDNAAQLDLYPIAVNNSGSILLSGWVPQSSSSLRVEQFVAIPINPDSIPPDDFEVLGDNGLPVGWPCVWNNAGSGNAAQYNSGGAYSYNGNSTLRLHVHPGGGSTFVLSDPIPVLAGRVYALSAEMRYALSSDSDMFAFTVLQYNDVGNEIAINEVDGVAADNRWAWKRKAIFVQTLPNTHWLRVRFGLISSVEAFADVDDLR